MRFLRLLGAGLIAVTAVMAVMCAAVVVFLAGLAGFAVQLFRGRARPARPVAPGRQLPGRADDIIDIEAIEIRPDPGMGTR